MSHSAIDRVAVLGAGNMGHGISQVAAMAGYDVTMRDIEQDLVDDGYESIEWSLEKLAENDKLEESPSSILDRIGTTIDLETAVEDADMIVEAVPEQLELKHETFAEVDELAPPDAILASNTSSLSITKIAEVTERPDQVVGTHYFNPPVQMDLVEVIYGKETSDTTAEIAFQFVESLGKTPIYVRKDVHGFVVNSVLFPYILEPAWMVSNGEATIKEADAAMVYQCGYPMGPFELTDLTGIDINYHVLKEAEQPVPPIMEARVDEGAYGRKAGRGYYNYEDGDGVDYSEGDGEGFDTLRVEVRMVNEALKLIGDGVATPSAIDTGMRLGANFPEGICERGEAIGLDTVVEKLRTLQAETGEERFEPADYLVELVEGSQSGDASDARIYD